MGWRVEWTQATPPPRQIDAVHDGGVHLGAAVGGKGCAAAGVEKRIVFEHFHGSLNGVKSRATFFKDGWPAASARASEA